jgi:hypothetical protein
MARAARGQPYPDISFLVSLIDSRHNIAETMAYTEEKGNYSSQ